MSAARHVPNIPDLREFDEVGSTNDIARDSLRTGAAEGAVIWAHRQTAGRGRQGNSWTSAHGNLFMSLILRPQVPVLHAGQLSFLSAVALAETVEGFLPAPVQVRLKWPNDMLINGKKAAGILLESESAQGMTEGVVIGIGVNLASAPDGATSLAEYADVVNSGLFLERLYHTIMAHYHTWRSQGFADIRQKWLQRAWKKGEVISVRLPAEVFSGVFSDLADDGSLYVTLDNGMQRRILSGEVFL